MTEKTNRSVFWAVGGAVYGAVDRTVADAVYWEVWQAVVSRAVDEAVRGTVFQSLDDQSHPALQAFLGSCSCGAEV